MNKLTILVMGKSGVGKSSTVNSIIGERAVVINPFQVHIPLLLWINELILNAESNIKSIHGCYFLSMKVGRTETCNGIALKDRIYDKYH